MSEATKMISATPILASLDISKSIRFYTEKLGFTQGYLEQGVYGIVQRGKVEIHFWACEDKTIAEATSCRIQVQGIADLYAQCLKENIVHPKAALAKKPWGTEEFAIVDLYGNLITFYEEAAVIS